MLGYTSQLLHYANLVANQMTQHQLTCWLLGVIHNAAFSTGQVPQSWKTSLVTLVFKHGDATDTANYRPISVDEPFSTLYPKVMYDALSST